MKRPLSPHLSIYRLPLTANMSILHRITGAMMFGAMSFLCWVFILGSSFSCECIKKLSDFSLMIGVFSLCYHISTGIRHLVWDAGYLLEKKYFLISSVVCLAFSAIIAFCLVS